MRVIHLRKIFTLLTMLGGMITALASQLTWKNLPVDNAMTAVYSLHQSADGYMWVGCGNGLYSYDGFHFYAVPDGSGHAFVGQVYGIVEREGDPRLWLGTNNGLYTYCPGRNASVERVDGFPNEIRSVLAARDGTLWIGTLNGLWKYNPDTQVISDRTNKLPHRAVYALLESGSDGRVYIGTYDGLCRYDPLTGEYEKIDISNYTLGVGNDFVISLGENYSQGKESQEIIIGTEGALLVIDTKSGKIRRDERLNGNSVKSIAFSPTGLTALGTDNGVYILDDGGEGRVGHYRHDSRNNHSPADNTVEAMLCDNRGNLWAGTGSGVAIADDNSGIVDINISDITGNGEGQVVHTIFRDSHHRLWIGGNGGVIRVDAQNEKEILGSPVSKYDQSSKDARYRLAHNRVRCLFESSRGHLWLAGDGGLNIFDEFSGSFRRIHVTNSDGSRNTNWAYSIIEDQSNGKLWAGGYLGGAFQFTAPPYSIDKEIIADTVLTADAGLPNDLVNKMVHDSKTNAIWVLLFREPSITRIDPSDGYRTSVLNVHDLTGGWPTQLVSEPEGGIWCGFDGGGVVEFDSEGHVSCGPIYIGRPSEPSGTLYAMAIVGDDLWVATGDGVHAINRVNGRSRLLPIPSDMYTAVYADPLSRKVLLGATDHILQIDPRRLSSNKAADKPISFVHFFVGDKETPLNNKGEVVLEADDAMLAVELATFDFSPQACDRFSWRCLPGDTVWTFLSAGENIIKVVGPSEGKHTLEVRLGDDDSSIQTLNFVVKPKWYLSVPFKILWVALVFIAMATIFLVEQRRTVLKIRKIEHQNQLEKAEERLQFLKDISKDLQEPLEMIIGPLSRMNRGEQTPEQAQEAISTAYYNALRLNRVITHTLEHSRSENKQFSDKSSSENLKESDVRTEQNLRRISDIISANIANPDLNVAFLSEQSGIQQKQLYRLMKKQFGESPVEHIRRVRMQRAAILLATGEHTVSEVMYRVGFSSPSYFSRCFVAQFGCRPQEYLNK